MARRAYTLDAVNQRLRAAKVGLIVVQRGDRLSLRGTLPPKPGSTKTRPSQQTISLGVHASPQGLEYAESKALEYGALINQRRFSWLAIADGTGSSDRADTVDAWIASFQKHVVASMVKPGQDAAIVWRDQWWYPALRLLSTGEPLTDQEIIQAAKRTKPNSRSRQIACQKLKRLAVYAGVEVDLRPYSGGYSPSQVKREIPSDDEIIAAIAAMTNPEWQWVAGMMATYGLRDHECWYASLAQTQGIWFCTVADGKTGGRESIPPLHSGWPNRWQLSEGHPPGLTVSSNKQYGDRTARAFHRQKVGFSPYSLRHAYAIRGTLKYGFPTAVMAGWLGHDPQVFLGIYQRHISHQQSMDLFLKGQGVDRE